MADPVRDFLVDENGDMAIADGDFATVAGSEAVKQGVAVRLRTFLGEIWLDEAQGVDYLGQILVRNPHPVVVRELLRTAIAATPDVTKVLGAELVTTPDRQGSITYEVLTVYSDETAEEAVTVRV